MYIAVYLSIKNRKSLVDVKKPETFPLFHFFFNLLIYNLTSITYLFVTWILMCAAFISKRKAIKLYKNTVKSPKLTPLGWLWLRT